MCAYIKGEKGVDEWYLLKNRTEQSTKIGLLSCYHKEGMVDITYLTTLGTFWKSKRKSIFI